MKVAGVGKRWISIFSSSNYYVSKAFLFVSFPLHFCHESIFTLLRLSISIPMPSTLLFHWLFSFCKCFSTYTVTLWRFCFGSSWKAILLCRPQQNSVIRPDEYLCATRGTRAESTFCRLSEKLVQVQPSVTHKPFNLLFSQNWYFSSFNLLVLSV